MGKVTTNVAYDVTDGKSRALRVLAEQIDRVYANKGELIHGLRKAAKKKEEAHHYGSSMHCAKSGTQRSTVVHLSSENSFFGTSKKVTALFEQACTYYSHALSFPFRVRALAYTHVHVLLP